MAQRLSRDESREIRETAFKSLREKLPDYISELAKANSEELTIDIYAYLISRFTKSGTFRVDFLKTLNYYLVEEINEHLQDKLGDNDVINGSLLVDILTNIYQRIEKLVLHFDNQEQIQSQIKDRVEFYKRVEDSDQVPVLQDFLVHFIKDWFYKVIFRRQEVFLREDFFHDAGNPRAPYLPKITVEDRVDGRGVVRYPGVERAFSITQVRDNTDIFRTTMFMRQGGPGSSHHLNLKNDQATQALAAWQLIDDPDDYHFVHGSGSFRGMHAEEQLIKSFVENELRVPGKHPEFGRSIPESQPFLILLHLFISKSPCRDKCLQILKNFLNENPKIGIQFYLQQWYESNDFGKMKANVEAFLLKMEPFIRSGRVTCKYLPLATSPRLLYAQHKAATKTTDSPFYPMPSGMVDAIYMPCLTSCRIDDNSELSASRERLWYTVLEALTSNPRLAGLIKSLNLYPNAAGDVQCLDQQAVAGASAAASSVSMAGNPAAMFRQPRDTPQSATDGSGTHPVSMDLSCGDTPPQSAADDSGAHPVPMDLM